MYKQASFFEVEANICGQWVPVQESLAGRDDTLTGGGFNWNSRCPRLTFTSERFAHQWIRAEGLRGPRYQLRVVEVVPPTSEVRRVEVPGFRRVIEAR